jgi:hypothetical protein
MSFEKKLKRAHRELAGAGIPCLNYNPPLIRILRKFGIKVRPPHYHSFIFNSILVSIFSIVSLGILILGVFALVHINSKHGPPVSMAFVQLFDIGWISSLFGILMAAYFKYNAKKHGLSKWKTL